jgi:putative tricarboxylic transport membrane protein
MRAAFIIAILFGSVFYTYGAFENLNFLSSAGRLGPGFFPRIIGIGLIAACLLELALQYRRGSDPVPGSDFVGTTVMVTVLTGLLVLSLGILGGYIGMTAFMLVSLFLLNRSRPVQNLAIGIALPLCVYLMFDVWLEAPLPRGVLLERLLT